MVLAGKKRQQAAIVLLVKDHMDHGIGCSASALDVKERVTWAWNAAKSSPAVRRGKVTMLTLNVSEGSVNGSKTSVLAEMLRLAAASAGQVLPALAKSWDPEAPSTMRGTVSAKLGAYEKVKHKSFMKFRRHNNPCGKNDFVGEQIEPGLTVEEGCCAPMTNLEGTMRAAQAMLVASVFASELSTKERLPVLVLGRPPGHHATCEHRIGIDAPQFPSPGGALEGPSLGGGCFFPSCWLAAVHCMRKGVSQKMAYIDVDAHKPDGVWKEVDHLCNLGSTARANVFNGNADACQGVMFASVHVDGYPKPDGVVKPDREWRSVTQTIPQGHRRAFPVWIQEELLPAEVATGTLKNEVVLDAFARWRTAVAVDLRSFKPDGLFIGLGFDLHKFEKEIGDKPVGMGLTRQHYSRLIQDFPSSSLKGPVVLTLEGGYTKAGVVDGILGVISGLELLAHRERATKKKLIVGTQRKGLSSAFGKGRTSCPPKLKKVTSWSSPALGSKRTSRPAAHSMEGQKRARTAGA